MRPIHFTNILVAATLISGCSTPATTAEKPNVVMMYADDLGYGDLSCYGATMIHTPNLDRLAKEGRVFTDHHSPAAVCTPSRYALLTGRYPWRDGIRPPVFSQSPLIIDENRMTLADVFKKAGYNTACIGKWHLGFGSEGMPDWNGKLKPGPLELGFDYYYGVPVVNSHPPFVYVENHRVVGLDPDDPLKWRRNAPNPNAKGGIIGKNTRAMKNGFGFRGGKKAHELYVDEEIGMHLTEKALDWLKQQKKQPFFLYFATTQIHHPITPNKRFQSTSKAGPYGDFVHELDWMVGGVRKQLEAMGVMDNTIFIFSSDNGGMPNHESREAMKRGHRLNGPLQGFKFDAWEGGHRVPLIVRWPGHVPEGTQCNQLCSTTDLLRTFAGMLHVELDEDAATDSVNMIDLLTGSSDKPVREKLIYCPQSPKHYGLRKKNWVYIPAKGGGGFGNGLTGFKAANNVNSDITPDGKFRPDAPDEQLYNLDTEPNQQVNVIREHPEIAAAMRRELKETMENSPFAEQIK